MKGITRRELLHYSGIALGAAALTSLPSLRRQAFAQEKTLNVIGASYNMQDRILNEFTRRTGITVKPTLHPSATARVDKLRTGGDLFDTLETGIDGGKVAWDEGLIQPIDLSRIESWPYIHTIFKEGKSIPKAPYGMGDNPARLMYVDQEKTKAKFLPYMYNFDSIAYNPTKIPAENNVLSWGELFNPKWRGKVSIFGIAWLGIVNTAIAMHGMGLLQAEDLANLKPKEVDTVIEFLMEKKKEGHFRAFWKSYGELVNLMASEEVWIADAWWPVVQDVKKAGTPCRYAEAKEGYRAWAVGSTISARTKNLDLVYEWLNFWVEGFAGAKLSDQGFYSTADTFVTYLTPEQVREYYGGCGRDGGSIFERSAKLLVWNTIPTEIEYYNDRWNEFLAL